jgi:hypothetical protein
MACTVFWHIKVPREIHGPHCVLAYQNTEGNLWSALICLIKILREIYGPHCSVLSKY